MRHDDGNGESGRTRPEAFGVSVDDPGTFTTLTQGRLRHDLHRHPLFQMPALASLARELVPLHQCRFVRPGTTTASAFMHADRHPGGYGIQEVFDRIEEPGSWIALYNIEAIPRYKALLTQILDSVRGIIERDQGSTIMETGFIFISAPPSATPFHIDRENNFWLQLHGRKTMTVWRHDDRATVDLEAVEDFIVAQSLKRVRYTEAIRERGQVYDVGPGEGVYFPSTSPHMTTSDRGWVVPGDGVSVSIGVNFYTEATVRAARVHQVNRLLRKSLGLTPRAPRQSPALDQLKAPIGRVVGATRRWKQAVWVPLSAHRRAAPPPPGSF